MGWEGATGHLYMAGDLVEDGDDRVKRHVPVQGRKIKALQGGYDASLALVDGWELAWMTPPVR